MTFKEIKIVFFLFCVLPLASFAGKGDGTVDSVKCKGYHYFVSKGIQFDSTSNLKLYNEVYGWLGVPYRYGGRSKRGADCSGFASLVYKSVYSIYVGGSAGCIYKELKPIEKSELKEGDLIFFSFNHRYIAHVGIYLSNNKFIHETSWGKGVRISDLDEAYYKRFYFSAGRYEENTTDSTKIKPIQQNLTVTH
jgi:lipoprotein Spr